MKIGIMLRHYSQHGGGVKVYTENLLREMLSLDTQHEFVLIYRDPKLIGTYNSHSNVRELAVKAHSVLTWDQIAVRQVEKKEGLDLIFNPKYSVPLLASCPTVYVCHGLDWCVEPKWSRRIDRISHKFLIPRYAKKADAIIAVSETTRQHLIKYLGILNDKVHTVYHGIDDKFNQSISSLNLKVIRDQYRLPARYFLYVGQIYPPKNFGRLIRAYAQVGPKLGISLVIAGEHRWLCREELALIDRSGISSFVVRAGWINHETLPGFYAMAEALLLPSLYESFGIPLLEAMSVGCPVITSDRYSTQELGDQAAMLVNPEDIESIANGMRAVGTDSKLRQRLIEAGRERASDFSWKKCALETLKVLENVKK